MYNKNIKTGAKIKIITLALDGNIVSFTKSFKPSANGALKPTITLWRSQALRVEAANSEPYMKVTLHTAPQFIY